MASAIDDAYQHEDGFYWERSYESTPSGGDFSEIIYLDGEGNLSTPDSATRCVIRECAKDGALINEVLGACA